MQTVVVPVRIGVRSGTTNNLHELPHRIIVSYRGNEDQLDNSLDAADVELTKKG